MISVKHLAASIALLAAACNPPEETAEEPSPEQTGPDDVAAEDATATSENAEEAEEATGIETFEETAWRVTGEDGARYTTYLDSDGTYRDFRNGEPYQSGAWQVAEGGKLCLDPDAEGALSDCWAAGKIKDDLLPVANDDGRRVELRRVTYRVIGDSDEQSAE